jgi:exopolyphosphatase/guanosine-5'-triphosphate,3'-diphosphate pyrophosphatase
MPPPSVAVIDIGSNTIKLLVARQGPDGALQTECFDSRDARISTGIGQANPQLTRESMACGVAAVRELLAVALAFQPVRTVLVATSAVRDAQNGRTFCELMQTATGHVIRILSGREEANLIGSGLTCDPALAGLQDFYVFDLGGGSLECLAFEKRRMRQAASLPLGCVRLTEKLFPAPAQPLPADAAAQIAQRCTAAFHSADFRFDLPRGAVAVGTGGTPTVALAIEAARAGSARRENPALLTLAQLKAQFHAFNALSLAERRKIPGLPPARADVYPTALATLISVAELGGFDCIRHSHYNLRYGLARETLDSLPVV